VSPSRRARPRPRELDVGRLAARIKACREQEGLTLLEAAGRSGVAPSTIQKIETGQMVPTVVVLNRIARGLRRRVSYFVGDEDEALDVSFTPAGRRPSVRTGRVEVRRLGGDLRDPDFDAYRIVVPPRAGSGRGPVQHGGNKLIFCLRGQLAVQVADRQYRLGPGDSVHLKSILPHSWKNLDTRRTAEALIVGSFSRSFETAKAIAQLRVSAGMG
jgi:transcriptional regulator with XRE-family HTH domain